MCGRVEPIKNIVSEIFTKLSVRKQGVQEEVQLIWEEKADLKYRKHTRIAGLRDGVLTIHVDSPPWLFQLSGKKKDYLRFYENRIPEIREIRFKIGSIK